MVATILWGILAETFFVIFTGLLTNCLPNAYSKNSNVFEEVT